MLDKESFSDMHAAKFPVGTKREAAHQMLTSGCTQVARPAYLPNRPKLTTEHVDGTDLPVVNLWIPSDIDARSGDITPYLDHASFIIPEQHERQTVLDSFAFWCRTPQVKTNWALFLGGVAGIGKDALLWPVGQTVGRSNYGTPTPNDMENNYTDWLAHRKLIIVDTIRFSGKQSLMENLKPWIAAPPERLRINGKFVPQYEIANLVAFVFMANRPDALKLDPDDRRFFVYWTHAKPKPPRYYRRLWDWMRANVGAIGHYFLHEHEISERFDPLTPPPMTVAKRDMMAASEGPLLQFLRAAWDEGHDPLRQELVQVREIEQYLALHRPQLRQTSPHAIGQALRELGAKKLPNRLKLKSGERPHVWALAHADTYATMDQGSLTDEYQQQEMSKEPCRAPTLTLTLKKTSS
jgi:hypothetical protein